MGLFGRLKETLAKTKDSVNSRIEDVIKSFKTVDEDLLEELEEVLIMSDLGVNTSTEIIDGLRERIKEKKLSDSSEVKAALREILVEILSDGDNSLKTEGSPVVVMVIGVNGVGKTTSIGKLAYKYGREGKKVVIAAADTFRAAAIEQLEVWAKRADAEIIKQQEGSDPAAVIFDAIGAAKKRGADILLCDTAGRLHNKKNLMEELKKISRIIREQGEGCAFETLLVLDATTGQNAVNQAKLFSEVADITGIVLTKLDGTAKGGIIISIHNELGIPVKLVGVGEKVDDLQPFNAHDFAEALFDTENDFDYNYERLTDDISEEEENAEEEVIAAEEIVEETAENDTNEEISEDIVEAVDDIDENDEEEPSEAVEEITADDEKPAEIDESQEQKKDIKNGKFGFLFKEITFGKKKKDGDEE